MLLTSLLSTFAFLRSPIWFQTVDNSQPHSCKFCIVSGWYDGVLIQLWGIMANPQTGIKDYFMSLLMLLSSWEHHWKVSNNLTLGTGLLLMSGVCKQILVHLCWNLFNIRESQRQMIIFWGKQQNTLWWGPFWIGQIHAEPWQLTLSEFVRYLRVSEAVARVTASFQFWHSELVRSQVYQNSVLTVLRSNIRWALCFSLYYFVLQLWDQISEN